MMEKISVVIPFYSYLEWLDEAIDSVIKQTRKVDEIIVVNDGSEEDTSILENKYSNVIFIKQRNQGAAVARNKGIEVATGDLIMFLDSDDVWMKDKVEKQVKYMERENCCWSATYYRTFGVGKIEHYHPKAYKRCGWEHYYNSNIIQTSTVAVKKDALFEKNFAPDMRNGQDMYLWFKLANRYDVGIVPEELSLFRMRGSNVELFVANHIRVRAQLWEKMELFGELKRPKRVLTRLGYKICYAIYKRSPMGKDRRLVKENFFNKMFFACAWLCFRLDNYLLDIRDIMAK